MSVNLSATREKFKRAARSLRKAASKITGNAGYRNELINEADFLERQVSKSYVARNQSRAAQKEESAKKLAALNRSIKRQQQARGKTTKAGLEKAAARKERQERIFTKKFAAGDQKMLFNAFMQDTYQAWAGAENSSQRFDMIVDSFNATSINEAYKKWQASFNEYADLIALINARDYKKIKELGWSDDLINELKKYDAKGQLYKAIEERIWLDFK